MNKTEMTTQVWGCVCVLVVVVGEGVQTIGNSMKIPKPFLLTPFYQEMHAFLMIWYQVPFARYLAKMLVRAEMPIKVKSGRAERPSSKVKSGSGRTKQNNQTQWIEKQ